MANRQLVGSDVERVPLMRQVEASACLAFSAEAREALVRPPETGRQDGFFAARVPQEATLKLGRPVATLFEWSPWHSHRAAVAAAASVRVRHMPDP